MLRREILLTADGSATIRLPDWDESYHSKHGALQEARHVFIKNGLDHFKGRVSVLEMGFGTGLNALITFAESKSRQLIVDYVGIDAYPVTKGEAAVLNYPEIMGCGDVFSRLHEAEWEKKFSLCDNFSLTKHNLKFESVQFENAFDLVYFDAFGFQFQPDLWSADIFAQMFQSLKPGGILVTYAARTIIKRNMESSGFIVSKMPGPPGKREMMQAQKPL